MEKHTKYSNNIQSLLGSLPESDVRILFFYGQEMDKPKVIGGSLKLMVTDDNEQWYIMEGVQSSKLTPYIYAFPESYMRYYVTAVTRPGKSKPGINVQVKRRASDGDVQHGDHLDLGFMFSRRQNATILRFHKTMYVDHNNTMEFARYVKDCNFTFERASLDSYQSFCKTKCERVDGTETIQQLDNKDGATDFQESELRFLYDFCKIVKLGKQKPKPKTSAIGGATNMTFFTDDFKTFINDAFVNPIMDRFMYGVAADIYPENVTITFIWDENNTFAPHANEFIVMLHDFNHHRNEFYIDASIVFNAYFAKQIMRNENKTMEQLPAMYQMAVSQLEQMKLMCVSAYA